MKKVNLIIRLSFFILIIVLISIPFKFAHSTSSSLPSRLTFATLAVGTVFHVTGSGLAKIASERTPIKVVVSPMASARSWVFTMNDKGSPEIGIMQMSEIWQAYTGKLAPKPEPISGDPRKGPPYSPACPNLRILIAGTHLRLSFLVRNDSPIKTMRDMKGKRMTWGFPAFPSNIEWGLAGLSAAGMSINDVIPVPVPEVVAGVRALMEGRVDIAIAALGMPIVAEADATVGVRFLPEPMDSEAIKRHQSVMPGSTIRPVPPGLPGIKVETPVGHVPIVIQTSTHMPDEVAYTLVKAWWDHFKDLEPIHPQFRGWIPGIYVNKLATVPYHPGAIKFFKERGAWTSEHDKMQEKLLLGKIPHLED
ncbi:TPA: TAXI family TRAP transporter solute-binding subunit [Candidatus Poribacteria bacterium]|nr:TAXI family TRAP transporter solute-binding subunit [Candidatus Poribacteria bacterium]